MHNKSIYYAAGRMALLKQRSMNKEKLDKLLLAPNLDEARKLLVEFGWPDLDDDELNADKNFSSACKMIKELSVDDALTECHMLKYDITNIKILLKSSHSLVKPEALYESSYLGLEKIKKSIENNSFYSLPFDIAKIVKKLCDKISYSFDPALIDITLDKAYYEYAVNHMPKKYKDSIRYFKSKIDFLNFSMLLRLKNKKQDWSTAEKYLIKSGNIMFSQLKNAYFSDGVMHSLLKNYPTDIKNAASEAEGDFSKLSKFEKITDNYLFNIFASKRYEIRAELPIYYLLFKERETSAVRLILAGKANSFNNEDIIERMRDLYA